MGAGYSETGSSDAGEVALTGITKRTRSLGVFVKACMNQAVLIAKTTEPFLFVAPSKQ